MHLEFTGEARRETRLNHEGDEDMSDLKKQEVRLPVEQHLTTVKAQENSNRAFDIYITLSDIHWIYQSCF